MWQQKVFPESVLTVVLWDNSLYCGDSKVSIATFCHKSGECVDKELWVGERWSTSINKVKTSKFLSWS
jgi:hypothetical protein